MTEAKTSGADTASRESKSGVPEARSVGRPSGTTSKETKRLILNAARTCFAASGYAGTIYRAIGEQAGLTAATVHYHFGSKSELFLAVHTDIQDHSISRCRAAVGDQATMQDAITALLDTLSETQSRHTDILRFNAVVRIEAARYPEIASARDDSRWRRLFADISQLGVSTNEISADDEHAVRAMLATLVLGLADHAASAPRTTHMEAIRALKLVVSGAMFSRSDVRK